MLTLPHLSNTSLTLFLNRLRAEEEYEEGWHFGAGDPEWWKFQNLLVKPRGDVLDLGSGYGRSALYFALYGMNVTCVDKRGEALTELKCLAEELGLQITTTEEDFVGKSYGSEKYDLVIMAQCLVHSNSKTEALSVICSAIKALRPGGHIWIRTSGKTDSLYNDADILCPYGVEWVDNDVYLAPCGCSGEYINEPHLFLDPIHLLGELLLQGLTPVHTQTIPTVENMNFMYGEDWDSHYGWGKVNGGITILARKK